MNKNINISLLNNHFFIKKREKPINDLYVTKINKYNFFSLNEYNISGEIKKIPYYFNYYLVVEDYDYINISEIDDDDIKKISDYKYLDFKYKKQDIVEFSEYLYDINNPKLFILTNIQSFTDLLNSLIQLNENNICFFNLSPENIVFNLDCGENIFIHEFKLSINLSKLTPNYMSKIIEELDNYTYKPLEVHILFYLIKNDMSSISYNFIEEICNNFVNNLSIMTLFSESYRENYKKTCVEYLKKYINKLKNEIIIDILSYNNKWDIYSLSIIYLHIFGNVVRVFSLKGTFINKIINELSKNLHPNPQNRNTLKETKEIFNKYINEYNDWSFINKLDYDKMSNLFKILDA